MKKVFFTSCLIFLISIQLFSQSSNLLENYKYQGLLNKDMSNCASWRITIPIDFNNDGILDFISSGEDYGPCGFYNQEVSYLRFFENDGKNNFVEKNTLYSVDSIFLIRPDAYLIDDFNGDGKNDIFITGEHVHNQDPKFFQYYPFLKQGIDVDTSNGRWWRRNHIIMSQPNGKYKDVPSVFNFHPPISTAEFCSGNINNDGKRDIIIGGQFGQGWDFIQYINDGNGNFTYSYPFNRGEVDNLGGLTTGYNAKLYDINKDGFDDFFFTTRTGKLFYILNNRGSFNGQNPIFIDSREANNISFGQNDGKSDMNPIDIQFEDLNKDGEVELIVMYSNAGGDYPSGRSIYQLFKTFTYKSNIFVDNSNTFFPSNINIGTSYGAARFELIDLNKDGFKDIYPVTSWHERYGYRGFNGNDSTLYFLNNGNKFLIQSLGIKFWSKSYKDLDHSIKINNYNVSYKHTINNCLTPIFIKNQLLFYGSNGIENGVDKEYYNKDPLIPYYNFLSKINQSIEFPGYYTGLVYKPISPLPQSNQTQFSIKSGENLKIQLINKADLDSVYWIFNKNIIRSNISNQTFSDSGSLKILYKDQLGNFSDTLFTFINMEIGEDTLRYIYSSTDFNYKVTQIIPGNKKRQVSVGPAGQYATNEFVHDVNNDGLNDLIWTNDNPFYNGNIVSVARAIQIPYVFLTQKDLTFKPLTEKLSYPNSIMKGALFHNLDVMTFSDLNGDKKEEMIGWGEGYHYIVDPSGYRNTNTLNFLNVNNFKESIDYASQSLPEKSGYQFNGKLFRYYSLDSNNLFVDEVKKINSNLGFSNNLNGSIGDVDGDNDIDILMLDQEFNILYNDSKGNFNIIKTDSIKRSTYSIGRIEYQYRKLIDLNSDGKLDLLVSHTGKNSDDIHKVGYYNFNTDGSINTNFNLLFTYPANVLLRQAEFIDLDKDGKIELISTFIDSQTDGDNNYFKIFTISSSGIFETTSNFIDSNKNMVNVGLKDLSFQLVDLNKDGYIDIVPKFTIYDPSYQSMSWFPINRFKGYWNNSEKFQYFKNQKNKLTIDSIGRFSTKYLSQNWRSVNYDKSKDYSYTNNLSVADLNNDSIPELISNEMNILTIFSICNSPKPTFTSSKYSFCSGDSLKLTISNINKGDTLKWYYGTKSDLTNVNNKTFTDSTKLFVTRTDSLGCVISSDTVQIKKYSIPSAPTLSRDTANFLLSGAAATTWYKDGSAITDTAQKYKPTAAGSYTAKTTTNGCTSVMSAAYYYLVTDIINLSKDEFIKLAPNPFINQLNFDFIVKGYQRLNIEVFDVATGTKVASQPNLIAGSRIALGQLSEGTYLIRVTSNDSKINQQFKVVKM